MSFLQARCVLVAIGLLLLAGPLGCGRSDAPSSDATSSGERSSGETATSEQARVALGRRVYQQNCLACHQADGAGVPSIYPPLQKTAWVAGDEGRLIRLLLHGMRGPVTVQGVTYDQVMTPHGFLSDRQLAAVLTYVRSNFGNSAGAVTPAQVRAVRAHSDRDDFWTAPELRKQTGVPD